MGAGEKGAPRSRVVAERTCSHSTTHPSALPLCRTGFLAYNFQHIMRVSHIHLSLAHSHRTTAFCAFAGCRLTDNMEGMKAGWHACTHACGHGAQKPPACLSTPVPTARRSQLRCMACGAPCGAPKMHGSAPCACMQIHPRLCPNRAPLQHQHQQQQHPHRKRSPLLPRKPSTLSWRECVALQQ